ncbi:MAG: hypothetical protein KKF41_06200 [Actinobacteria bacterium]|nr:hypothetical protein [Actinomycetota bacterium]MBU2687156.1 hypothetical protein [Actinomycetota bacterium]
MSVYSEPVERDALVASLEGADSVVILSCPFCASLALSYQRDLPAYRPTRRPSWMYGAMVEANELKERLEREGKRVSLYGLNAWATPFCTPGRMKVRRVRAKCRGADAVVVMSCTGGLVGVSQMLGRSSKVIHGMRSVGCGTFTLRFKPPFDIAIVREATRVSRFNASSGRCEPD